MSLLPEVGLVYHVLLYAWYTVQSKSSLGGTCNSRDDFRAKILGRLGEIMDPKRPVWPKAHNIVGGGPNEEWAVVEMTNQSNTNTGPEYNNTFAWVMKRDTEAIIVQVRTFARPVRKLRVCCFLREVLRKPTLGEDIYVLDCRLTMSGGCELNYPTSLQ